MSDDAPETPGLSDRSRRAVTEAMTVDGDPFGGVLSVTGESAETYAVDVQEGRCTCPDHTYRGVECKHLRRARLAAAGSIGAEGVGARAHTRQDA